MPLEMLLLQITRGSIGKEKKMWSQSSRGKLRLALWTGKPSALGRWERKGWGVHKGETLGTGGRGVRLGLGEKLKNHPPRTLEASGGPGRKMCPHSSNSVAAPPLRTHDPHIALQGQGKGTKKDNCHAALQIQKGALLRKLRSHRWSWKGPCAWSWPQSSLHLNILRKEKVLAGSGSMCGKGRR